MSDDASTTSPSKAPLPAVASRLLLVALIASAVLLALRHESDAVAQHRAAQGEALEQDNLIAAVLTNRPIGPEGRPTAPASGPGSQETPLQLRFVPSGDKAQSSVAIDAMLDWLERYTGYHIHGAVLNSYGLVISELQLGRADVAFLTAASYARAYYMTENNDLPGDDIEALLMVFREGSPEFEQSSLAYRAAMIVRTDSPLQSVDDLSAASTVGFGGKTSGAGSLLPGAMLTRRFGPENRPQIQRFTGGYKQIIAAVMQGKVDAGSIWWSPPTADFPNNDARTQSETEYPEVFGQTRIIGFTSWMPNEPVVVRAALPDEVKRTLQAALPLYVALKRRTPEGRKELLAIGSMEAYIPVTNESYRPLFQTIEGAFAGDPEGLRDFQAGAGR